VLFILGSIILLFWFIFPRNKREASFIISKIWAKTILYLAGIKVEVSGEENLNFSGPKVLVCNHQGNFDIPILMATLPTNFRFLAKIELFKIPIFGWHLKNRTDVPIDRKNPLLASKTIMNLSRDLKDNYPILIFPEGTRSPDGKVASFKKGSVMLALETKAQIVPIGISGSYNIQKKGSLLVNPTVVKVKIGKPINPDFGDEDLDKTAEYLREIVISLVE